LRFINFLIFARFALYQIFEKNCAICALPILFFSCVICAFPILFFTCAICACVLPIKDFGCAICACVLRIKHFGCAICACELNFFIYAPTSDHTVSLLQNKPLWRLSAVFGKKLPTWVSIFEVIICIRQTNFKHANRVSRQKYRKKYGATCVYSFPLFNATKLQVTQF